jgi:hypothetical protein
LEFIQASDRHRNDPDGLYIPMGNSPCSLQVPRFSSSILVHNPMLAGIGPAERSESSISISINSVRFPISSGSWPTTPVNQLIELNTVTSYINITLPSLQAIPAVLQQAVEEIDEIPEFSISQSVAARAIFKIEQRMNIRKPVLRIGRGRVTKGTSIR